MFWWHTKNDKNQVRACGADWYFPKLSSSAPFPDQSEKLLTFWKLTNTNLRTHSYKQKLNQETQGMAIQGTLKALWKSLEFCSVYLGVHFYHSQLNFEGLCPGWEVRVKISWKRVLFSSSENQVGIKHLTVLRNPLSYSQKIETTARSKVPKKDERTAKTFELLKITLSLTNPIH